MLTWRIGRSFLADAVGKEFDPRGHLLSPGSLSVRPVRKVVAAGELGVAVHSEQPVHQQRVLGRRLPLRARVLKAAPRLLQLGRQVAVE